MGQEIPRTEIKKMIASHDLKENGILDFDEFKTIFQNQGEWPFGEDGPVM